MLDTVPHKPSLPIKTLVAFGLAAAFLAGLALAGWLDHGAAIFLTMASSAWAYCF